MSFSKIIKLGIIGLSEGNGHPYSWSAIFNGYDPIEMARCPFPVIFEYLEKQTFPEAMIAGARVTHIWTQDRNISDAVASASKIEYVVERYEEMIGAVDAVLLARDDSEQHFSMSRPFLEAGVPVYIDKPVTTSLETLDLILNYEQYPGQIFSCSAFRYATEFKLSSDQQAALGNIYHVDAVIGKSWEKYAVHIIEPVLNLLGCSGQDANISSITSGDKQIVTASWGEISATFSTLGCLNPPITLRLYGEHEIKELIFSDTFSAFKAALEAFIEGFRNRRYIVTHDELRSVVSIIERGMPSG